MKTDVAFRLLAYFFALLSFQEAVHAQAVDVSEVVKRAKPWVVTIVTFDDKGEAQGQGSGFFLESGDLITSHHVLAGAMRAVCHDANNNTIEITSIIADFPEADLIKARTPLLIKGRGLALAQKLPLEGEKIVTIGSPRGMELTVSDGIVSAIRQQPSLGTILQITAPISPGSSGGPVLNMKGEVVGIVEVMVRGGENLNFATPVEFLSKMHDQTPTPLRTWSAGQVELARRESDPDEDNGRYATRDHETAKSLSNNSVRRGMGFLEKADYKSALAEFQNAILQSASNGPAWVGIGACYEAAHDFEHATEGFQNAVELMPNEMEPLYHLGKALFYTHKYADAVSTCRKILALNPRDGQTWNGLGRAYAAMEMDSDAIDALRKATLYAPGLAESHVALGMIYAKQHSFQEAEEELHQAISIERTPDGLMALGVLYIRANRTDEGRKLLDESLDKLMHLGAERADPELLEDIGGALFRIGAYNAALTALRLGLIVNPKSAVMHHDLASCYMRLHEIDVAISEYRQSIRYDPTLPEPHYDLGLALFEFHHDKAAALEQCDILRRLDAKSADRLYKEINK